MHVYGTPNLASIGQLLGDPTRTLMLEVLYDGRAWSATELANSVGIGAPTASSHLRKLVDAGLIVVERAGRHRFYQLAGSEVAEAIEALLVLAAKSSAPARDAGHRQDPLRFARSCYDHVAGHFGVSLTDAMLRNRYLVETQDCFLPGAESAALLAVLDIDLDALQKGRRPLTRRCLDWSERRHHLGGALGAAMMAVFLERRWIRRQDNSRALQITSMGKRKFGELGLLDEGSLGVVNG